MIQIDIDMPTDCASCWIRQNMGCKIANASGWLNNRRDDKCPLKEQEAVEPTLIREGRNKYYSYYVCPRCDNEVVYDQNYCSECGVQFLWEGR